MNPNGYLRRQVLNFMDLPVMDLYNKEIFLSSQDARNSEEVVLIISEQPKYLPVLKEFYA